VQAGVSGVQASVTGVQAGVTGALAGVAGVQAGITGVDAFAMLALRGAADLRIGRMVSALRFGCSPECEASPGGGRTTNLGVLRNALVQPPAVE
jgi:hypothetical protein